MLADEEIDKFVSDQVPNNTKKKTKSDVQLFERWLESIPGEIRSVEEIPPVELNKLLRNFYLTVRKQKSNEEYEPDTLVSIKNSIDRYLTEKGYGYSLSRSEEFKTSRDVLSAKGKQLKKDGRGRRSNRADEVSPEEEKVQY